MTLRPSLLILSLLSFVSAPALAQDAGKSLKAGDPMPGPFRMFVVSDERFDAKSPNIRTGKLHCFVCEAELNPTVAVFSRTTAATESAAVKMAGMLNELVNTHRTDRFGAFVAFLTLAKDYQEEDGRDEKAKVVRDVAAQAKLTGVPFGLAAGKSAATDLYGLKETDDLTVIFFNRMKVVKVWTFSADKPPTAEDLKAISDTIKEKLKK
ncbi:MAG: hypothetical protein U0798_04925 [Gemmataceae bacterium]